VLTTYGTQRRDAWRFKDAEFDYVVLNEAQVVKNAETESSKAVRLLRGRHRELESEQRNLYDELRQHDRDSLLRGIETAGLANSKIQVLEALLRLQQAACHPGLLDSKRSSDSSAKLDVLLEQLREGPRGRTQGAGVLAVHQFAEDSLHRFAPSIPARTASPRKRLRRCLKPNWITGRFPSA
jgi:SNF2 family DNA or RNA helicase